MHTTLYYALHTYSVQTLKKQRGAARPARTLILHKARVRGEGLARQKAQKRASKVEASVQSEERKLRRVGKPRDVLL